MATLTQFESQARDAIEASRAKDNCMGNWSACQAVRTVFSALYAHSLPTNRVHAVADALCGITIDSARVQAALTLLTRDGLLRSRLVNGVRHYELAL